MSWMFRVMKNPVKAGTKKKEIRDLFFFYGAASKKTIKQNGGSALHGGNGGPQKLQVRNDHAAAIFTAREQSRDERTRERERERCHVTRRPFRSADFSTFASPAPAFQFAAVGAEKRRNR